MSLKISADDAYSTYCDLNLKKKGSKSASIEVVTKILQNFCVEVLSRPTDPVTFIGKTLVT